MLVCQPPAHPHHCRAAQPPLHPPIPCSAPPSASFAQPHISLAYSKQGSASLIFYGCFEGKVQWGKPPEDLSVPFFFVLKMFLKIFYQKG